MLNHRGTITINTDRLILRKFSIDDVEDMFYNWANDEEVAKYLSWSPHGTIEVTKEVISEWICAYEMSTVYNWAIELKATGKVIGSICVIEINDKNCRCEVGYCISRAYWNKGIMTESLKAANRFLFSEVGINRIQAKHDTKNIASGKVMEKAGMKYEGTLKQYKIHKDGTFGDLNMYAIVKEDMAR